MGKSSILGELEKDAPPIILLILLGIIIDRFLLQGSNVLRSLGVSIGTISLYEVFKSLANFYNKRKQETKEQDDRIIKTLENWENKTQFANIYYKKGILCKTDTVDPSIHLLNKDIQKLKQKHFNIYPLWENGKNQEKTLINEGEKAIKVFHTMVDEKLKKSNLEKLMTLSLKESSLSTILIREVIFNHISKIWDMNLSIDKTGRYLKYGEIYLAHGNIEELKCLKKTIKYLMMDKKLITKINRYKEIKKSIEKHEAFSEFQNKKNDIIKKYYSTGKIEAVRNYST